MKEVYYGNPKQKPFSSSLASKVLLGVAGTIAMTAFGVAVLIEDNLTAEGYEEIDNTGPEYTYVMENVEALAQDWTKELANAGIRAPAGMEWNVALKVPTTVYVDRETGFAFITYTKGKGKAAAYICEAAPDGGFLFHEFTSRGKLRDATTPTRSPQIIQFCERGFEAIGADLTAR